MSAKIGAGGNSETCRAKQIIYTDGDLDFRKT